MAETYEVTSQRTAMEVDPSTNNLVDTLEVTAKAIPSGVSFTRRYPLESADPASIDSDLAMQAMRYNTISNL